MLHNIALFSALPIKELELLFMNVIYMIPIAIAQSVVAFTIRMHWMHSIRFA